MKKPTHPRDGDDITIELDIAGDCAETIELITAEVAEFAKPFNIEVHLVKEIGPGGGNPLYSFTGAEDDLRKYVRAHHHRGLEGKALDEEVEFLLGND